MFVCFVSPAVFVVLLFADGGTPNGSINPKLELYYFYLYAVPSTTCFFIVLLTTIALVVRLNKNLEWRRQTSQQRDKTSDKEIFNCLNSTVDFILTQWPLLILEQSENSLVARPDLKRDSGSETPEVPD
ncbi:hypothetical protein RRG08_039289 [Elysia crispata]|uniref:Uncharacterized protein n=1 Tax=Elysia crispata TaxID=231223 RepID=A0AAE0Z7D7_9GAST|nr:hypothetical protein RRG08_039289 [Elysia crispata]